jgi:hypothetical protein
MVAPKVVNLLVHRITNRVLVGKELARDEDYLRKSLDFTGTLLPAAVWTNFISFGIFRKFAAKFTTFFHRWKLAATTKILLPIVQKRLQDLEKNLSVDHDDSIQWTILTALQSLDLREHEPQRIVENILHLLFAANSAPGALATQMLYEALITPSHIEILRDEISSVVAEHGGWTWDALAQMPFLDSFTRETLRVYPPGSSKLFRPTRFILKLLTGKLLVLELSWRSLSNYTTGLLFLWEVVLHFPSCLFKWTKVITKMLKHSTLGVMFKRGARDLNLLLRLFQVPSRLLIYRKLNNSESLMMNNIDMYLGSVMVNMPVQDDFLVYRKRSLSLVDL